VPAVFPEVVGDAVEGVRLGEGVDAAVPVASTPKLKTFVGMNWHMPIAP
jgi:hypothetical protein